MATYIMERRCCAGAVNAEGTPVKATEGVMACVVEYNLPGGLNYVGRQ